VRAHVNFETGQVNMKDKWKKAGLALAVCFCFLPAWPQQTNTVEPAFRDEPAAHQLYQDMVEAMRNATTLSWTGEHRWKWQGKFVTVANYRIWLKKPNYARVEMTRMGQKEPSGILVGDGDYAGSYGWRGKTGCHAN
jgi:outer membrane lipoprotein-sorting protein